MSVARRVRRLQLRKDVPELPSAVVKTAEILVPLAARHGAVVGAQWSHGVWDVGAYRGATLVCWGCGDELGGVAGTSRHGPSSGPVSVLVRVCERCLPPETRTVRA